MAVSSEERLFSLLLALAATQVGLTKHEILSTVHGYSKRYGESANRASIERQFERDKDALRDLGIPIESFEPLDQPENNQLTRYRIRRELLQLPEDLTFTPRELSLLRLAAFAWRESTVAAEARSAQMKLSSLGDALDEQILGIAPRITAHDSSFVPLQSAAESHRIVSFEYRKRNDISPEIRRVAPLALEKIDGRWHLISWDLNRDAPRTFLLARIASSVKLSPELFDAALLEHVETQVHELHRLREAQVARLVLVPGSEAAAQLSEELHYLDEAILAEQLVEYGADVYVLEPASLRAQVIQLLSQLRDAHETAGESLA